MKSPAKSFLHEISSLFFSVAAMVVLRYTRHKFYAIAGGSFDSGDVTLSRITTAQRIAYFRSWHFRLWVKLEKAAGRRVLWLKDVDKTQAAGDIFTFFFLWRIQNNAFSEEQIQSMRQWFGKNPQFAKPIPSDSALSPHDVLRFWEDKDAGLDGWVPLISGNFTGCLSSVLPARRNGAR